MKLSFLPAMAVLVALVTVTLAAPFDTRSADDITLRAPGLQALPTSSAVVVLAKDMVTEEMKPTLTTPQHQPRADYTVPFQPTYQVLIGNDRQHVGQFQGELLKSEITKALQYLCPEIKDANRGETACKFDEKYVIKGVEYRADAESATNAVLNVWVSSAFLPWNARNDFIETAAMVYSLETKDAKNCYTDTFDLDNHKKDPHYWCNVGREVEINTINGYGAHLYVNVAFNGKTTEWHFDCVAIQQSVIDGMHTAKPDGLYRYTQWYEDHNGYPPNIALEIWCPDKSVSGDSVDAIGQDTGPDGNSTTILFDENWQPSPWEQLGTGGAWLSGILS